MPTFPGVVFYRPNGLARRPQFKHAKSPLPVCSPPMSLACLSSSLWFLVYALLLPLLFLFGNDLRIPHIHDETTGLSETEHSRMGLLLLLVFVLLLPAGPPGIHETGWDDPLTHQLVAPEAAVLQEDGTGFQPQRFVWSIPRP